MVHSRVLAKDEVRAAELVHCRLALVVRIELAVERDSVRDLLSNADIRHFLCFCMF